MRLRRIVRCQTKFSESDKTALAEADVHAIILGCDDYGVLAQLVERLNGIEEVRGSNPLGSTI
jgi:hypothetical protein